MSDNAAQNYANHRRMVAGYHYFISPLSFAYLLWSLWRAFTLRDAESHFDLLGAVALVGAVGWARLFPLKAQDRIIRLEEQLRLSRILPADLAARVHELRARQLIALRFASDAEVAELVREVLAGTLKEPKQIKQRIKNWRADNLRV